MSQILLSPAQVRAALSILDWSNQKLADVSGLYVDTIAKLCRGESKSHNKTIELIKTLLEREGLEFLEGDGVRRVSRDVEIFIGKERFYDFEQTMYDYLAHFGGEICLFINDERKIQNARKDKLVHRERMLALANAGKITGRILAAEGEFKRTWADVRRSPDKDAPEASFYVFGDCMALISFEHDPSPYVILIRAKAFAETYRRTFNAAWERGQTA